MQFFASDKRLQEIFFQNNPNPPPPPPAQELNGRPLRIDVSYELCNSIYEQDVIVSCCVSFLILILFYVMNIIYSLKLFLVIFSEKSFVILIVL